MGRRIIVDKFIGVSFDGNKHGNNPFVGLNIILGTIVTNVTIGGGDDVLIVLSDKGILHSKGFAHIGNNTMLNQADFVKVAFGSSRFKIHAHVFRTRNLDDIERKHASLLGHFNRLGIYQFSIFVEHDGQAVQRIERNDREVGSDNAETGRCTSGIITTDVAYTHQSGRSQQFGLHDGGERGHIVQVLVKHVVGVNVPRTHINCGEDAVNHAVPAHQRMAIGQIVGSIGVCILPSGLLCPNHQRQDGRQQHH